MKMRIHFQNIYQFIIKAISIWNNIYIERSLVKVVLSSEMNFPIFWNYWNKECNLDA